MEKKRIQLVSSDLNGTLVHQHTMMDMIRLGFPDEPGRFEKAAAAFSAQTAGRMRMKEAFGIAGPLTKGLSLRSAIEYARRRMAFLEGFEAFLSALKQKDILFVINSTGYSVTTEVIRAVYGRDAVPHVICNRLIFGKDGDPSQAINEKTTAALIADYIDGASDRPVYDQMLAVGDVQLGIADESEKARLLFDLAADLNIPRQNLAHIGDTMGDSRGIVETAENGGIGIAFNYNDPLKQYLETVIEEKKRPGDIFLLSPKSRASDLRDLLDILC